MAERQFNATLELRGRRRGVDKAFANTDKAVSRLASRFASLATTAGTVAIGAAFVDGARKIRAFEKSVSDLGAITGATGNDLKRLEQFAKDIGATTTLSATQAAEAFKLVASAKPDLLENIDALNATTKAAVTLSEAAGIELPAAAEALGESLNQFSAGAEEANRFINVLAAGSKLGASEIDKTSEALRNAGVVAHLAGLSFEETNALIQGMAFAGVKGSDAGTKLRAVLIKLQNQADDNLNPAIVGVNQALANLEEKNLSVAEKTELFGERSIATADILISQRENIERLSGALGGTNTAYEQAAIRTDNLDGALKRLGSAYEAVILSFSSSTGTLTAVVMAFTELFEIMAKINAPDGGTAKTTEGVQILNAALRTLFVTGSIVKNAIDALLLTFQGLGRILGAMGTRDLDNIRHAFEELENDIVSQFDDIGETMFRAFSPEDAALLDAALRDNLESPIIERAQAINAALSDTLADGAESAGQTAARELREAYIAALDKRLEDIRMAGLSEVQAEREKMEAIRQTLNEGLANRRISEQQHRDAVILAETMHQQRLAEIESQHNGLEALNRRIEEIRSSNMTKVELEQVYLAEKLEVLRAGLDAELLTRTEYDEQLIGLAAQTAERIAAIQERAAEREQSFTEKTQSQKTRIVLGEMQSLTAGVAQHSKTLFQINKAAALAEAIVSMPEHISKTMAKYPYPLSIAMGALAGAASLAQINAIRSATFEGGGAGTTPSSAGTAPVINDVPVGGGADSLLNNSGQQQGQIINVNIEGLPSGSIMSSDAVRGLIQSIGDELGDNVNFTFTGG